MAASAHMTARMGRVLLGLAALWGSIGVCGVRSWAGNSEANRATLRRLQGVDVVVEDLRPDVERAGLTRQQLQTDVELQLQKAGMPLLTRAERAQAPGQPWLAVHVHVVPRADGLWPPMPSPLSYTKSPLLRRRLARLSSQPGASEQQAVSTSHSLPLCATVSEAMSINSSMPTAASTHTSQGALPQPRRPLVVTSCAKSRNAYRRSGSPLEQLTVPWDPRRSKPYAEFQNAQGLRNTGDLDEPTLNALGLR